MCYIVDSILWQKPFLQKGQANLLLTASIFLYSTCTDRYNLCRYPGCCRTGEIRFSLP